MQNGGSGDGRVLRIAIAAGDGVVLVDKGAPTVVVVRSAFQRR